MENIKNAPSVSLSNVRTDPPPTISLATAIARAASWRNLLSSLPGKMNPGTDNATQQKLIPKQLIFRAININMSDINWLQKQHPDAKSIRLYLSIQEPGQYQIHGMLVPVDAQNRDMLTLASNPNVSEQDMMDDPDNSTIYDFTQPCPTVCNPESPLFDDSNDVSKYLRFKK